MAQVTAYTTEKTDELIAGTIQHAHLSGYDLVLVKGNGDEVNVGNVRGAVGPTGGVSSGQLADAIAASEGTAGKGVIAFDVAPAGADDSLGSTDDTWYTLAGVSVTTPALVSGRHYSIFYGVAFQSASDLCAFDVELLDGGSPISRTNCFAPNGGRSAGANGHYPVTASGGWSGAKTLTMRARFTVAGAALVDNTYFPAYIQVVDLGKL